jgi:23S rRNA (cytosine1962-C5)-methyltransferase
LEQITIHRRAAERLLAGHVWVYESDVDKTLIADRASIADGAAVNVVDGTGRSYGSALYDATAGIALRLYSRKKEAFDEELLRGRLEAARRWRTKTIEGDSNAYRLVFSEADHLPGLVVDQYGAWLSVQVTSSGMAQRAQWIVEQLVGLGGVEGVMLSSPGQERQVVWGEVPELLPYRLNGYEFSANLLQGQKTGTYLDQRESYARVKDWAERLRPGRFALDAFSSSGGFAVHVADVFERVDAVDSSRLAVAMMARNAAANGKANIRCTEGDVGQYLQGMAQAKRRWDLVVLDPPAYAKGKGQKSEALRTYYELNQRGMRTLSAGGILVSCSCSYHVSEGELMGVVAEAAAEQGRELRLLEKKGQGCDHPVLVSVPESNYLKCLILQVA